MDADSACARTGWRSFCFTVHQAAFWWRPAWCLKESHSYSEYVFDWAWANACAQHGLDYYPRPSAPCPLPFPGAALTLCIAQLNFIVWVIWTAMPQIPIGAARDACQAHASCSHELGCGYAGDLFAAPAFHRCLLDGAP